MTILSQWKKGKNKKWFGRIEIDSSSQRELFSYS